MTIKIEKGVPLANALFRGGGRPFIYPFLEMEVGDSFAVSLPAEETTLRNLHASISNCSIRYTKRRNPAAKFTTRLLRSEGVIRCWRVA